MDDTAIIATSRQPALLLSYLETYISVLERWLTERRIAFSVSKSTAMLFGKAGRRINSPRTVKLLGEPIHWVETTRYLGVTLDKRLGWSTQGDTDTRNVGTSPEQEEWSLHQEWSYAV